MTSVSNPVNYKRKVKMQKMFDQLKDEKGAATAEYAIATMAAVGFAGLLVVIMRSEEVKTILFDLVKSALTFTNPNGDAAVVPDPAPAP
jgi:Flp pilus assembly pilin Flp